MKKVISILLLSFLFFACDNHKDKIELFLLKHRVRTNEGIPVLDYVKLKNIKYDENLANLKDCNYDSVSKTFIYGGRFSIGNECLEAAPFLTDEDVLKLNLIKSELILSENGRQKIAHLKPNMMNGVQFAICVNRKPLLTGYFRSIYSSYVYNWNYINYDHYNKEKRTDKDTNFIIRQNQGYQKWNPIVTDLNNYPELIAAFKKSKRLEN
jgi:hypothetical protein